MNSLLGFFNPCSKVRVSEKLLLPWTDPLPLVLVVGAVVSNCAFHFSNFFWFASFLDCFHFWYHVLLSVEHLNPTNRIPIPMSVSTINSNISKPSQFIVLQLQVPSSLFPMSLLDASTESISR